MRRSLQALLRVQPFVHSLAVEQFGCRLVHASSALQVPAKAVAKVVSAKPAAVPQVATKSSSKVPTKAPKGKVEAAKKAPTKLKAAAKKAPTKLKAAPKVKAPAPKKPINKPAKERVNKGLPTGYGLFFKEHYPAAKAANPDKKIGEMFRVVGTQFKALSTNEKQAYFNKAREIRDPIMKERFKDRIANKRPASAYALFATDKFPKLKAQNEKATVLELGKEIGALWKKASEAEKKPYTDRYLAAVEKQNLAKQAHAQ